MSRTALLLVLALLLSFSSSPRADAKEKQKLSPLPADILRAETAFVTIHPDAGEPLTDINASTKAREAVERALMKWGRFRLVLDSRTADLIFTVRAGTGQMVHGTVKGSPTDNSPVIIQPGDSADIRIGAQRGRPPVLGQPPTDSPNASPRLATEAGMPDDMLEVYRGRSEQPVLDAPPVWRYIATGALRAPAVPAVEQFQKAIVEAEKAANQKQPKP